MIGRSTLILAIIGCLLFSTPALAQLGKARPGSPDATAVSKAYKLAEGLFERLKEGKNEEVAKWIVEEIGFAWNESTKLKNTNEYIGKLDLIQLSPPDGSYGTLDAYDLIEESALPGSDRYFRLTYITYHEASPLVWQFRFYVRPDKSVALHYFGWSDKNPFEYLSTGDLQLLRWYGR